MNTRSLTADLSWTNEVVSIRFPRFHQRVAQKGSSFLLEWVFVIMAKLSLHGDEKKDMASGIQSSYLLQLSHLSLLATGALLKGACLSRHFPGRRKNHILTVLGNCRIVRVTRTHRPFSCAMFLSRKFSQRSVSVSEIQKYHFYRFSCNLPQSAGRDGFLRTSITKAVWLENALKIDSKIKNKNFCCEQHTHVVEKSKGHLKGWVGRTGFKECVLDLKILWLLSWLNIYFR